MRPIAPPLYVIADQQGVAVSSGPGYRKGDHISAALLARGTPVTVANTRVARSYPQVPARSSMSATGFLTHTNRILIGAIIGGGISALIICIVLTQVSDPADPRADDRNPWNSARHVAAGSACDIA